MTSADSTTYKYRDETFPPLTPFEVKVGVYNNKGDGPFSKVVVIHSAEGGELILEVALILNNTSSYRNNQIGRLPMDSQNHIYTDQA